MPLPRPIALLAAVLVACGPTPGTEPDPEPIPLLEQLPRPLTAAEQSLIGSGNAFTFDLFRHVAERTPPDSNVFISATSASFALGLVLNGARGSTFDAMRVALRLGTASQDEINQGYRSLIDLLLGLDSRTEMRVANAMFSRHGLPLRAEFVDAGRTWFDAEVEALDFSSPDAVSRINAWVNEQTNGRISKLLESIDRDEVLFLVNALYFKGKWRMPFDPDDTRPAPFHGADGVTRTVSMMSLDGRSIRAGSLPDAGAIELLYGNGAFAMAVILPDPGSSPLQVLAGLDQAAWSRLTSEFAERRLELALPRFRIEYERALKPDLDALGMGIAFEPYQADFSGIADIADQLYLTRVLQKAFVEVNEEGTEAAAATAVGVGPTSLPPSFVVDRPFVFVIYERLSGTVLFTGLVNRLG